MTLQRAQDLLSYDPDTGILTWLQNRGSRPMKGRRAGGVKGHGYWEVKVDGVLYKAHRLAWLLTHGRWPVGEIDHVNGNRADNRLCNLREASKSQNLANRRGVRAGNTTGYRGVQRSSSGRFTARMRQNWKWIYLGTFDTAEEAAEVVAKERQRRFGEFAGASS